MYNVCSSLWVHVHVQYLHNYVKHMFNISLYEYTMHITSLQLHTLVLLKLVLPIYMYWMKWWFIKWINFINLSINTVQSQFLVPSISQIHYCMRFEKSGFHFIIWQRLLGVWTLPNLSIDWIKRILAVVNILPSRLQLTSATPLWQDFYLIHCLIVSKENYPNSGLFDI